MVRPHCLLRSLVLAVPVALTARGCSASSPRAWSRYCRLRIPRHRPVRARILFVFVSLGTLMGAEGTWFLTHQRALGMVLGVVVIVMRIVFRAAAPSSQSTNMAGAGNL